MKLRFLALPALALGFSTLAHAEPSHEASVLRADVATEISAKGDRDDDATMRYARIENSNFYVVYIEGPVYCGRAGCVPYIYRKEANGHFVHFGSLPVSQLPIAILPTRHNGMPDLGLGEYPNTSATEKLMPAQFVGGRYFDGWDDHMVPLSRGKVIISDKTPATKLWP